MAPATAFLLNDTSVSGHPGCVTVMSAIRANLERRGIRVTGSWPVALDWNYGLYALPGYRHADVIVVNGEGTIHHTATRRAARELARSARNAKSRREVPVYLVNATLEAVAPEDLAELRHFDRIWVRESTSLNTLRDQGFDSAGVVPDLCLSADFDTVPRRHGAVFTDSVLPGVTAALRQGAADTNAKFLAMQPPRALSYVKWAVNHAALSAAAADFYRSLARASAVITGRFHAVIFCLLARTPFLAVASNTSKIEAMLRDALGDDSRVVKPGGLALAAAVPPYSADELARLGTYIAAARQQTQAMFDVIAGDLKGAS